MLYVKKKMGFSGISLHWPILALRNETIWSGFHLYLTVPRERTNVHYVASRPNPLKVKVNSDRVWDIVISH